LVIPKHIIRYKSIPDSTILHKIMSQGPMDAGCALFCGHRDTAAPLSPNTSEERRWVRDFASTHFESDLITYL
jgi:hypothetical protein